MYAAVQRVIPGDDYQLTLTFDNGEVRLFDMKPYLNQGIFKELKDIALFKTVKVHFDSIEWANEADFDPEILYSKSQLITEKSHNVNH